MRTSLTSDPTLKADGSQRGKDRAFASFVRPGLLLPSLLLFGVLASAVNTATAVQTVFRCGDAYSNVPCVEGGAIDVGDARTSDQLAAAREVAAREAQLAAQMTHDRERSEAATALAARSASGAKKTRVSSRGTTESAALAPLHPTQRRNTTKANGNGDDRNFVAFVPKPPKQSTTVPKSR